MDRTIAIANKLIVDFITTQRQPKNFIETDIGCPIPVGAFFIKKPSKNNEKLLFTDSDEQLFCDYKQLSKLASWHNIKLVEDGDNIIFEKLDAKQELSLNVI
jgi:hypothetical protein